MNERTRTYLFGFCFVGLWIPFPLWFIGSIAVASALYRAPPSLAKKCMFAFCVLTPLVLLAFVIAASAFAASTTIPAMPQPQSAGESLYGHPPETAWSLALKSLLDGLTVISAVCGVLYFLSGGMFILCADMTFRSMHGPVTRDLSSPLYLRGVHLGLNLAGMFTLMPLLSLVGIPITLHQLRKIRQHSSGMFVAAHVFGIVSFLVCAAGILLFVVGLSAPSPNYYISWTDRDCENRRANSQNTEQGPNRHREICHFYYANSKNALQDDPRVFVPLAVVSGIHVIAQLLFVIVADRLILKAIGSREVGSVGDRAKAAPQTEASILSSCPACSAPLQFTRTGAKTAVQCYKCSALCEFETAL
jgi:hypothetical protein